MKTPVHLQSVDYAFVNYVIYCECVLYIIFGPEKGLCVVFDEEVIYLELVYLVTALVPSETACLANSPGSRSRTAVWISRLVMVLLLL